MISQLELLTHLADYLQVSAYKDYAPNGLQVAGRAQIKRIVSAVTASQAAIDFAIEQQADALIVHHGYFWRGEAAEIVGMKKQRLQKLLTHDINLFAYHLPLDQHPDIGNNALFAKIFPTVKVWQSAHEALVWQAEISAQSLSYLESLVAQAMQRKPQVVISPSSQEISRIAWCTGGAQDYLQLAAAEGAQLFMSGEYSERTYHEALETGCHYFACGHHATERAGIRALGEYLSAQYDLENCFYDEANPF